METTAGVRLRCLDCATDHATATGRCPDCGGVLDTVYDDSVLESGHDQLFADDEAGAAGGLAHFAPVLPFSADQLVTLGEGQTPLVDAPTLAADSGVETVLVKDESHNTTGGLTDREMALAVTAAREAGAETVALPTTGNGGQSAAAYAGRAGLDSESFVPSRTTFANKAMINVHGGEMSVVGGRYPDAREVFEEAIADADWHSLAPFATPFRHEGAKTLAYELVESLGTAPDAVVHPTGHGTGLVGLERGFRELARTGPIDSVPRLYAAQPSGCAPIAEAWDADSGAHDPVEHPDTICGALEIPDPAGGSLVLDALDSTDGGAVAVEDDASLDAAIALAGAGVPASATGGVGVRGVEVLAERGVFDADETVVVVNPATANREADILRSHLRKQGI